MFDSTKSIVVIVLIFSTIERIKHAKKIKVDILKYSYKIKNFFVGFEPQHSVIFVKTTLKTFVKLLQNRILLTYYKNFLK